MSRTAALDVRAQSAMRKLSRTLRRIRKVARCRDGRRLFLESLEPRQLLATVGAVSMLVDDYVDGPTDLPHLIEGRDNPGTLFFTKELTDPEQDYVAVIHYSVGFLQEDDGNGGIAEGNDTTLG